MKPRHWILGVLMAASTVYSLSIPDAKGFLNPASARMLTTHVPCAIIGTLFLCASAWFGFKYLRSGDLKQDIRLAASIELGTVMAFLTLGTGILFSKTQWGEWWQNDPRQMSYLIVCLFYSSLLAVRSGFKDPVQRAKVTSAYALALIIPNLFLTFVFPRLPQVITSHPNNTIVGGLSDPAYRTALWLSFAVFAWLLVEIYRWRVAFGEEELMEEESDGLKTDRIDSAGGGVVRPVALHSENQTNR